MVINLSEMPTGRGVEIPLGNDAGGAGGAGGAGVAEVRVEVRRGRVLSTWLEGMNRDEKNWEERKESRRAIVEI
jgi:hypothetical protein